MSNTKSVGIWIRVSTEDQAQGESPQHHEKRARFYAESKEWEVKEVYHLEAVSGKSVINHPETKRMLGHIVSGRITGLIFSKLARLARNTKELLEFADFFREHNADLISLQEAIDTSSPAGRLFYTMIAAMAQWEREEISERVAASVPVRAKLGKPLGGQAPFGYQWKVNELVPDPKEAPVRKLIHELFLEHQRKKTVARILNERGYRTRKGAKFSDTTITRLLRDTTAKGIRRANYTKSLGDGKKWVLKPQDEWVHLRVEPIISENLWDRCNQILDEQEKSNQKPTKRAVHLFTGFAYCQCGNKMYVPSNSPKYICHKCRNKIGKSDLEEIFHHQLRAFFTSSDEIVQYLSEADKIIKEKQELLKSLQEEQQKITKEMDRLFQLHFDGEIPKEGFGRKYNPLEERYQQIDAQIPELQGEIDFLKIRHLASDQIISDSKDLYARWHKLVDQEKRKIIESITEKIIISSDDIAINLSYLPSSSEMMAEGQRNLTPALPFCHVKLKAPKPFPPDYPNDLKSLGDHIRKRRFDLKLLQRQLAEKIGVSTNTITNWELNRSEPEIRLIPKIIEFLGYIPYNICDANWGEKIVIYRQVHGLSQEQLAQELGIDPSTLGRWEKNETEPSNAVKNLMNTLQCNSSTKRING